MENTLATGHPRFPRRDKEPLDEYMERLRKALGAERESWATMPDQRMPYREPEEPEVEDEPGEDG